MNQKFEVYVGKPISEHISFEESLKAFLEAVMAMVKEGTSWQVLETVCWISGSFELEDGKIHCTPLYFYDARDFAITEGVLVHAESGVSIADPLPSIPEEKVHALFIKAGLTELRGLLELQREMRANFLS